MAQTSLKLKNSVGNLLAYLISGEEKEKKQTEEFAVKKYDALSLTIVRSRNKNIESGATVFRETNLLTNRKR